MFAGIVEESCQIHFPTAVGISGKTDCFDEGFVIARGVKKSAMNAAKVNKIQNRAPQDEKGFKFIFFGHPGKVENSAAFGVHGKLANAFQVAVPCGVVCHGFGAVGNVAKAANALLFRFFLNG